MLVLPSGSCTQLFSPLTNLKSLSCLRGRESVLWAELFCPGQEPSEPPGLAAEKRCIMGEGDLTEAEMGKAAWPGSFLRLSLAGCLKLHQLGTKRVFRHKEGLNLASARLGLAFEFRNPSPRCSQTGQNIPEVLLPPLQECQEAMVVLFSGPAPIVDPGSKLIRVK